MSQVSYCKDVHHRWVALTAADWLYQQLSANSQQSVWERMQSVRVPAFFGDTLPPTWSPKGWGYCTLGLWHQKIQCNQRTTVGFVFSSVQGCCSVWSLLKNVSSLTGWWVAVGGRKGIRWLLAVALVASRLQLSPIVCMGGVQSSANTAEF